MAHRAFAALAIAVCVSGSHFAVNAPTTTIPATDPLILMTGRSKIVNNEIYFDAAGSALDFAIMGPATVSLAFKRQRQGGGEDAFYIFVDDNIVGNFDTSGATATVAVTVPSSPIAVSAGLHRVKVFKTTEAEWNSAVPQPAAVIFSELYLGGGGTLQKWPNPPQTHKIEFVGDSITAGFCNMQQHTPPDPLFLPVYQDESFFFSWANQVCVNLDAECHVSVKSGFGMVRNCCNKGPVVMPDVFRRTLASVPDEDWTFASWIPDVVVINLGTNDGAKPGDTDYINQYLSFGKNISTAYGADVTLILACGSMDGAYCPVLVDLVSNFTSMGIKAHYLDLMGVPNECCGHPCMAADAVMATNATALVKKVMSWTDNSLPI